MANKHFDTMGEDVGDNDKAATAGAEMREVKILTSDASLLVNKYSFIKWLYARIPQAQSIIFCKVIVS